MVRLPRLPILALCMAATACAYGRVVADLPSSAYTVSEVAYAASDRDLRVVIYGNPFGMDPQSFGQLVTDNMQNRIVGVKTRFTTTPNDTARPGYWVALAFNPSQTMLTSYVCSGQPIPTRPPGGPIVVQGAFCRGSGFAGLLSGGALTSATGWLDSPQGPTDPGFKSLISDMTFSLFPTANQGSDRGRCTGC